MRLRRNERCPIHGRYWCCGREQDVYEKKRKSLMIGGVQRIEDPHHPRGYREKRSPAALRILLWQKIEAQQGLCAICREPFEDITEVSADHIEPRGMGGSRRDDHPDNIQAVHNRCNVEKGSRRLA